jgi:hypothetical protein
MQEWISQKQIECTLQSLKLHLIKMRKRRSTSCFIDELLLNHGHAGFHLPPYHRDFHPN